MGKQSLARFKWQNACLAAWDLSNLASALLPLPVCWAVKVLLLGGIHSQHSWIPVDPIPLRANLLITCLPGMSPSSLEAGLNLRGNWRTELLLFMEGFAICLSSCLQEEGGAGGAGAGPAVVHPGCSVPPSAPLHVEITAV